MVLIGHVQGFVRVRVRPVRAHFWAFHASFGGFQFFSGFHLIDKNVYQMAKNAFDRQFCLSNVFFFI